MAKKTKSVFNIILGTLTYLFVACVLGVIALGFWSNHQGSLTYKTYLIQSGSMEPSIMTGDIIFIKQQPTYQERDVVTFVDDNQRTVTHRIIDKNSSEEGEVFTTKGDANQSPDQTSVSLDQIRGKVFFTLPKLGYLVKYSKTKWGTVLFILMPASLLILDEVRKIFVELSN